MKKLIFVLITSISSLSGFSQAEQKIAELMNKGDYFTLLDIYPTVKDSLAYPFLGLVAEGGINCALNKPLEAIKIYDSLMNQYKNLDLSSLYSIVYVYTEQLAKIGKYAEAAKIINNVLLGNKMPDDLRGILCNLYNAYSKMEYVTACNIERIPNKNNSIDMITHDGYWYIPAEVDGKKEEFLFDTGAGRNLVSESFVKRNHVKIIADSVIPMGSGFVSNRIRYVKQGIIDTIRIGNILYTNVPVCIIDSIAPHTQYAGFTIDAILGSPFLEMVKLFTISIEENRMSFPLPKAPMASSPNMTSFLGEILVQASYKGFNFPLLIDTGCMTGSQINNDFFEQNRNLFNDLKLKQSDINMAGIFGDTIRNERYLIDRFPISIGNYQSKASNLFSVSRSVQNRGTGVIGIEFLKKCKEISFDFINMTMTLK